MIALFDLIGNAWVKFGESLDKEPVWTLAMVFILLVGLSALAVDRGGQR